MGPKKDFCVLIALLIKRSLLKNRADQKYYKEAADPKDIRQQHPYVMNVMKCILGHSIHYLVIPVILAYDSTHLEYVKHRNAYHFHI